MNSVSVRELNCRGTAVVTLGFTAVPELRCTPADIVLALDRTGSTADPCLTALKASAAALTDLICAASGGTRGKTCAGGTRLGLVTYGCCARAEVPLTASAAALHRHIDALTACGGVPDHTDALIKAQALLGGCSSRRRVILWITEPGQEQGAVPALLARACMDAGVELFCAGPVSPQWEDCVSAPADRHFFPAAKPAELPCLIRELAAQVVRAGAVHPVLEETLSPDFEILQIDEVSSGTAQQLSPRALCWTPDSVGVTGKEAVRLRFTVQHVGDDNGRKPVTASLTYRDQAGRRLCFPSPTVCVRGCRDALYPDACPPAREIPLTACQDCTAADLEKLSLTALGRIVYVNVTLRQICPGKRVALAVVLTELDACGEEFARGMKVFTLPAQEGPDCRNLVVKCIRFVVPEDLKCSCGCPQSLCTPRTFRARVLANYIDTDFVCCDGETIL